MKAKNKQVCILLGYYDEKGNYCETVFENAPLDELEESITENIDLNHDLTIQIVPGIEVRTFAKSINDLNRYTNKHPEWIKETFDAFSKYNKSQNGEYIHTSFDIES